MCRSWKYVVKKTGHGSAPMELMVGGQASYQAKQRAAGCSTATLADIIPRRARGFPWEVVTEWRNEGEGESTWARGAAHSPARGGARAKTHGARSRVHSGRPAWEEGRACMVRDQEGEGPAHQEAAGVAVGRSQEAALSMCRKIL